MWTLTFNDMFLSYKVPKSYFTQYVLTPKVREKHYHSGKFSSLGIFIFIKRSCNAVVSLYSAI